MIINGKNAVLGRLASMTAKKLLLGEEVVIVNAEKVIITGRPTQIRAKYVARRIIGSPQHGPFFPRSPDAIVRRTVRGMMPKEKKGRAAFKKLRVYSGVPAGMQEGEQLAVKAIRSNFMTVSDLAKTLGWNGR
ncbi:MAG TPA: 50S ribosomal protein L13 [archaeon]|nr:50S ribosomal protein L13 [archaeon]